MQREQGQALCLLHRAGEPWERAWLGCVNLGRDTHPKCFWLWAWEENVCAWSEPPVPFHPAAPAALGLGAVTGSFGSALSIQVCLPHLNSGLSLPSCGHPRAQDLKQAQVGEEGDQEPRADSGGTGGVGAQVSPEPLLAAGVMSAQSPAWGSCRDCILAPSSSQGRSSCRCFPSARATAAASHLPGGSVAVRYIILHQWSSRSLIFALPSLP